MHSPNLTAHVGCLQRVGTYKLDFAQKYMAPIQQYLLDSENAPPVKAEAFS